MNVGNADHLLDIGNVPVFRTASPPAILYRAGLSIDYDGAFTAYHPPTPTAPHGRPPALDDLRNAGHPGKWYGIVTDAHGEPYVQGASDPAPGFYVSATALGDPTRAARDPRRYVPADEVAYVSIPGGTFGHACAVRVGDLAVAVAAGRPVGCIVADVGPRDRIGEASPACARALGFRGGIDFHAVDYVLFPATRGAVGWPRPDYAESALAAFAAWGGTSVEDGLARLAAVLA